MNPEILKKEDAPFTHLIILSFSKAVLKLVGRADNIK